MRKCASLSLRAVIGEIGRLSLAALITRCAYVDGVHIVSVYSFLLWKQCVIFAVTWSNKILIARKSNKCNISKLWQIDKAFHLNKSLEVAVKLRGHTL